MHSDLKPDNVLLKQDTECTMGVVAKLSDVSMIPSNITFVYECGNTVVINTILLLHGKVALVRP